MPPGEKLGYVRLGSRPGANVQRAFHLEPTEQRGYLCSHGFDHLEPTDGFGHGFDPRANAREKLYGQSQNYFAEVAAF